MDLKKYGFPRITSTNMAFSMIKTCPKLLKEAKGRGFYGGNGDYNSLFSELFFNGGKLNLKKDLDEDFKSKALPYLRSFMGSFEPKHEEKEAICAMLLSELVDIDPPEPKKKQGNPKGKARKNK
jgi:hypothetical protein